ncbi:hypothetical protein MTO96_038067 [Rhipicephalus appendiculatus]
MGRKTDVSQLGMKAEAARQARLTAHGCATMYSAVETDVAANPAGWDRNSRGPGSGHDPRGLQQVGLVHEPSHGYCTLAGAAHQASSSDLGGATGTGPWTGPPGLELGQARPVQRPPQERQGRNSSSAVLAACTRELPARSPAARSFFFSSSSFLLFLAASVPPTLRSSSSVSVCHSVDTSKSLTITNHA